MTAAMNNDKKIPNVPNLRFPEFAGEWKEKNLKGLVENVNERISTLNLSTDNYVSTESILQNFQGVTASTSVPDNIGVVAFRENDILFSNIRPYLKKIWLANYDGGCSADVFVFRSKDICTAKFLYYLIANDKFIAYTMSGTKGTKMPRGDRQHINQYPTYIPDKEEQIKIANLLRLLDDRIATQSQIIEELESLIKRFCRIYHNSVEKKEYRISELGRPFRAMALSKDDLSIEGKKCILYGELFTKYDCVIDEVVSYTEDASANQTLSGENDLLFPASTTVDAVSLISPSAISIKNVILGGDLFGLRLYPEFNNEYLSYAINHIYKRELAKYAQGSTIVHLYYNDIKNVKLELPDLDAQNFFANLMRLLKSKIRNGQNLLSAYQKQKKYLLNQMFI